jgi:choline transport protein
MAEEVKNASRTVPRMGMYRCQTINLDHELKISQYAHPHHPKTKKQPSNHPRSSQMMATVLLNGALGLITIITYCFAIQSVEEQIIMSTAPYPFVEIFAAATSSTPTAIGMTIPIVLMTLAMCINATAAASRQAWSFARDEGLPFPTWFTRLVRMNNNSTPLPLNAMLTSLFILVVVALLNFGGSEVFNSIIGLMTGAVGLTYALSIACVLWRRLYGDPLPPARWSLGRWAVPINVVALLFELFSTVISFFPLFAKVDGKSM